MAQPAPPPVPPQKPRVRTLALQRAFLQHYANSGVIGAAARLTGIDRVMHYRWLGNPTKYPDYAQQFRTADDDAIDRAETELMIRGVIGWQRPIYGKLPGKNTGVGLVGTELTKSDRCLELLLKARRPDTYRERHEVTGKDGAPLVPVHIYLPDNGRG